jgi:hypothetical protein
MTLRVYRITAAGTRVELVPAHAVGFSTAQEIRTTLDWPPCRCPRCVVRPRRSAG